MFYQAKNPQTGRMWDTWLYWHDDTFYLYYLANRVDSPWDNISMATSKDGVHWDELGPVLKKEDRVTWMGTGSTWKSPQYAQDGKFQLNFSWWIGQRQTIWFAESTDLVHWNPLGPHGEFVQDEQWYEKNGRWDCIWTIDRPGGGLYGYWTASPRQETGGRFGFGESLDGVTWKSLAPPRVEGVGEGEVGAIEALDGRYYMMFGAGGAMWALVADRPEGPFALTARNRILLHGGPTYFARFCRCPVGLLVNHHSIARDGGVAMGALKRARVDAQGTMRLGWWEGNEAMKSAPVAVSLASRSDPLSGAPLLEGGLDAGRGVILEGTVTLPPDLTKRCGLLVECEGVQHAALLLNADGKVEFGLADRAATSLVSERIVCRDLAFGPTARFRLLLQNPYLELYLDEVLVECFSLPAPATGGICFPGGGVGHLEAWRFD